MYCLHNQPRTIETEFYVRPFVVDEEAARAKNHFLPPDAQACALFAADMRADLEKALMKISSIFIDASARTTISADTVVELQLREQAQIRSSMQIDMWHHTAHHTAVVILRARSKHPVIEIFVLRSIFETERGIMLRVSSPGQILASIQRIRSGWRVGEETPVLLRREGGLDAGDSPPAEGQAGPVPASVRLPSLQ